MKTSILLPTALAVSLVAASVLSTVHAAQEAPAPQAAPAAAPQGGPPPGMPRSFPKPTNLMVLPDDSTGQQVRDVMRKWAGDLGTECDTCHAEYADHRKDPRGRPMLDFASDEKADKKMARVMYTMMEDLKTGPIQKVKNLDVDAKEMNHPKPAELTCGTCHRGKLDPEAYVPPKREGPPGGPAGPGGPPMSMPMPPATPPGM